MSEKNVSNGLPQEYWDENYSDPESMDGIGNAVAHVDYIQSLFAVELIDISSVVDLGCGLGFLFEEVLKRFIPYCAHAIEPSSYAYEQVSKRELRPVESTQLVLENMDLSSWAQSKKKVHQKVFDLGICTSVFQYLSEEEIDLVLPIMAKRIKYLYFSVPTDLELDRQVEEVDFHDRFALRRTRAWYHQKLSPYFTLVSMRMLESKNFADEESTLFRDLLFRF